MAESDGVGRLGAERIFAGFYSFEKCGKGSGSTRSTLESMPIMSAMSIGN